jgi:hypothetical protein
MSEPSELEIKAALEYLGLRDGEDRIVDCNDITGALTAAAAARDQNDKWQPIETAPRDGTRFDAWCVHPDYEEACGTRFPDVQMRGDRTGFGFIVLESAGAVWHYINKEGPVFPAWKMTHWTPLPSPPTDRKDK